MSGVGQGPPHRVDGERADRQRQLGVPVKLVGLGEGPDDLAPFDAEAFVDAIVG